METGTNDSGDSGTTAVMGGPVAQAPAPTSSFGGTSFGNYSMAKPVS